MRRATLASPFTLLRTSWKYFWKHRALQTILVWLFIIPETLQILLSNTDAPSPFLLTASREWQLAEFLGILASIALSIIVLWGGACVLLIGKRMIQNKAGRSRTSFRSVRKDALPLIVPLFLTSLLQFCFLFYRSLLYLVPAGFVLFFLALGYRAPFLTPQHLPWILLALTPLLIPSILYYFQTFFSSIVLVSENVRYRKALRRSSELVSGKILPLLWRVLVLSLCTLIPSSILSAALQYFLPSLSPIPLILGALLRSVIVTSFSVLFVLSTVALFGSLRNLREVPRK